MAILKVIELMSGSKKSWEDATNNAVKQAAKSVNNIRSVWVKDQNCTVENGKIKEYRVSVKITFEVGK